jgi:excisionase family DNA binding protein
MEGLASRNGWWYRVGDMAPHLGEDAVSEKLPPFLRVEEAARILRISRSAAYELAHAWLETGGSAGLPVIRLGRTMRVPSAAIERLLQVGSDPDAA